MTYKNNFTLRSNNIIVDYDGDADDLVMPDEAVSHDLYNISTQKIFNSVTIGKNFEGLEYYTSEYKNTKCYKHNFPSYKALKYIVPDENPYFSVKDDSLYSKDKKHLVALHCEIEGDYYVDPSVESICPSAIIVGEKLKSIHMPKCYTVFEDTLCSVFENINIKERTYLNEYPIPYNYTIFAPYVDTLVYDDTQKRDKYSKVLNAILCFSNLSINATRVKFYKIRMSFGFILYKDLYKEELHKDYEDFIKDNQIELLIASFATQNKELIEKLSANLSLDKISKLKDEYFIALLENYILYQDEDKVKALIESRNNVIAPRALSLAINFASIDLVKFMLDKGYNFNTYKNSDLEKYNLCKKFGSEFKGLNKVFYAKYHLVFVLDEIKEKILGSYNKIPSELTSDYRIEVLHKTLNNQETKFAMFLLFKERGMLTDSELNDILFYSLVYNQNLFIEYFNKERVLLNSSYKALLESNTMDAYRLFYKDKIKQRGIQSYINIVKKALESDIKVAFKFDYKDFLIFRNNLDTLSYLIENTNFSLTNKDENLKKIIDGDEVGCLNLLFKFKILNLKSDFNYCLSLALDKNMPSSIALLLQMQNDMKKVSDKQDKLKL